MICGKKMKMINNKHLKSHDITVEEYKIKYPNAILVNAETSRKYSENAKKINADRDYSAIGEKISKTKRDQIVNGTFHVSFKGKKHSDETKKILSTKAKERCSSDEFIHWNTGNTTTDETKQKISESLVGIKASDERKYNLQVALQKYRESDRYVPGMLGKRHSEETKTKLRSHFNDTWKLKFKSARIDFVENNCKRENLTLIDYDHDSTRVTCKCNSCCLEFSFTQQLFYKSQRFKNICPHCFPRDIVISKPQQEIYDFISQHCECVMNDRHVLSGKEIDIYIPSLKLGIEFAGMYWHSEESNPNRNHMRNKLFFAKSVNVRLITIFEDEWVYQQDIVKSRLLAIIGKIQNKIYARKCTIAEIDKKQKDDFLIANHIQGTDIGSTAYGLLYNNQLVAVMTFTKTNMSKGGDGTQIELNRYAVARNTAVVGGAGKLFKHFIKMHENDTIISYSDNRWNTGKLYQELGFKYVSQTPANYWYFERKSGKRIHRAAFMKHKIVTPETAHLTEHEIMLSKGYSRIWDCGSTKYMYEV
jgi:hypothetical protein